MHLKFLCVQATNSKSSIGNASTSMYSQIAPEEVEHDIIESESDDDSIIPKDANIKEIK